MTTQMLSKQGNLIFDIELDKYGNLYYASYDKKCVYLIRKFSYHETNKEAEVFCQLKYVDPDKVYSNILMLNDYDDLVFIRVDIDKILVYEVINEEKTTNRLVIFFWFNLYFNENIRLIF